MWTTTKNHSSPGELFTAVLVSKQQKHRIALSLCADGLHQICHLITGTSNMPVSICLCLSANKNSEALGYEVLVVNWCHKSVVHKLFPMEVLAIDKESFSNTCLIMVTIKSLKIRSESFFFNQKTCLCKETKNKAL